MLLLWTYIPSAIDLKYGTSKSDLPVPEETTGYIAFVHIAHSQYQVAIMEF